MVSAAPPVLHIDSTVEELISKQWGVCLIATPTAATWIDLDTIARRTGCLTRAAARPPLTEKSLPRADAVLAAPLTFNTINKWAAGFSDSPALGALNELLSAELPILAAPCVKKLLQHHPAYAHSLARLTDAGVTVLAPDTITVKGPDGLADFDWTELLTHFDEITTEPRQR
ncbi:flavoprotein [Saccharothrix australiensis]|uniref:flavoprotein n=1 Tax=Saccharothrix australiensis TaxID=2072 RepID=UPI001FE52AA1|nr:flavoprotein [Saccharothrix australiensis]